MTNEHLLKLIKKLEMYADNRLEGFEMAISELGSYQLKHNLFKMTFYPFVDVEAKLTPIKDLVRIDGTAFGHLSGYLDVTINEMLLLVRNNFGEEICDKMLAAFNSIREKED